MSQMCGIGGTQQLASCQDNNIPHHSAYFQELMCKRKIFHILITATTEVLNAKLMPVYT